MHFILTGVPTRFRLTTMALTLFLVLPVCSAVWAQDAKQIGEIEYYGSAGIDLAALKAILPVHIGDPITRGNSEGVKARVRAAVLKATGRAATDVETVCCDPQGRILLYIGLPGTNPQPGDYDPAPTGKTRLPAEADHLSRQYRAALDAAVARGAATEDDSRGYAVPSDPDARQAALALRAYAVRHTPVIIQVLRESADAGQRATAAVLLGYAVEKAGQVDALVRATQDPDGGVRDEAIRALGVLARSQTAVGKRIPADRFITMLNSGVWTDKNKAAFVLSTLSARRDPSLLHSLRKRAFASLAEMARWDPEHAITACLILAHIAGMPDRQALTLAAAGTPEPIISAASAR